MPGYYSAQGASVSFNGVPLGYLTGFDWESSAQLTESTNVTSTVVGSGDTARVVKSYDATAVEPVKLSITFRGPPSFSAADTGLKATLVFTAPGVTFTGSALLVSFSHAGRVNQWTDGAAVFQMTD